MEVVSYKCVDERWTERIEESKRLFGKAKVDVLEY